MKRQLSPRDLEILSAYLDEQLDPRFRARLEARLEKEPDMRAALVELARTRSLLRVIPRVRVPRNFTLTTEMIGEQRGVGVRLYPTFRLASAIASLLFIAVVVGDFFGGRIWVPSAGEQAAPHVAVLQEKEIVLQEEIVEAPAAEIPVSGLQDKPADITLDAGESITYSVDAEVVILPESEQENLMRAVSPTVTSEMEEMVGVAVEAFKVAEEGAVVEEAEPPASEAPVSEGEVTEGEDQAALDWEMESAPAAEGVEELVRETVPVDAETVEELLQEAMPEATEETLEPPVPEIEAPAEIRDEHPRIPRSGWSLLHIIELILGVIAFGTGGLAFYFRRRR
jgi:hypothetical protein